MLGKTASFLARRREKKKVDIRCTKRKKNLNADIIEKRGRERSRERTVGNPLILLPEKYKVRKKRGPILGTTKGEEAGGGRALLRAQRRGGVPKKKKKKFQTASSRAREQGRKKLAARGGPEGEGPISQERTKRARGRRESSLGRKGHCPPSKNGSCVRGERSPHQRSAFSPKGGNLSAARGKQSYGKNNRKERRPNLEEKGHLAIDIR